MSGATAYSDLFVALAYVAAALRYGLFDMDKRPAPIDGLARNT